MPYPGAVVFLERLQSYAALPHSHIKHLGEVYAFLDANPRECVLVSLKREGTGKGNDGDLSRHLKGRYARERWFTEPRIPRLGEVRGKVVLVRRFGLHDDLRGEHGGAGWGVDG